METIITYALKVSAAIAVFYLLHIILLRGETFLKIRRFYFLFAYFFSLLFPFIDLTAFGVESQLANIPAFNLAEIIITAQETAENNEVTANSSQFNILSLLVLLASIGTILLLIKFAAQIFTLSKIIKGAKPIEKKGNIKILETQSPKISTFSFFRWIVLNEQDINESNFNDILLHEETHAKQLHSVDVMLYELFCIVFWWNPFAWLMRNEVKLNLEYLADAHVICSKTDYREYQYTLLQISIANTGMAFINNFNVSHLKKRIIMMNKKRSPILAMAKYILILPLVLFLIQCNSKESNKSSEMLPSTTSAPIQDPQTENNEQKAENESEKIYEIVEQMPSFPGGDAEMMKFIADNLEYPENAQKKGIEGRVVVRFTVSATGEVQDAKILRSLDEECDKESIRVVKSMPKWTPGKQGGKEVAVYFTLPILFRLK